MVRFQKKSVTFHNSSELLIFSSHSLTFPKAIDCIVFSGLPHISSSSSLVQVSCIAVNQAGSLLASGQTGPLSLVRLWGVESGRCLALFKTHSSGLHTLRYPLYSTCLCMYSAVIQYMYVYVNVLCSYSTL